MKLHQLCETVTTKILPAAKSVPPDPPASPCKPRFASARDCRSASARGCFRACARANARKTFENFFSRRTVLRSQLMFSAVWYIRQLPHVNMRICSKHLKAACFETSHYAEARSLEPNATHHTLLAAEALKQFQHEGQSICRI